MYACMHMTPVSYLIHDHVLDPLALLTFALLTLPGTLDHSLQELQELDVPFLLDAVDEVLNFGLCHLAAEVRVVSEYLCQCFSLYDLAYEHMYTYTHIVCTYVVLWIAFRKKRSVHETSVYVL